MNTEQPKSNEAPAVQPPLQPITPEQFIATRAAIAALASPGPDDVRLHSADVYLRSIIPASHPVLAQVPAITRPQAVRINGVEYESTAAAARALGVSTGTTVYIGGVLYPSVLDAARALGVSGTAIFNWLTRPDYTPDKPYVIGKPSALVCRINGQNFKSVAHAAVNFNVSAGVIVRWLEKHGPEAAFLDAYPESAA